MKYFEPTFSFNFTTETLYSQEKVRISKLLSIFILACMCATPIQASKNPKQIRSQIKKLSVQIEKKRAKLKGINGQEKILFLEISQLDQELHKLNLQIEEKKTQIAQQTKQQAKLEKQRKDQQRALEKTIKNLKGRLRLIYVNGQNSGPQMLQNKTSFLHYALHNHYLKKQEKADLKIFNKLKALEKNLHNSQIKIDKVVNQLLTSQSENKKNQEALNTGKKSKEALLKSLDNQQSTLLIAVRAAVAAQKKAQIDLSKIIQKVPSKKKFRSRSGRLSSLQKPVKGQIFRNFGVRKDKDSGARILNKGINFKARVGETVVAPSDGRVVYSGWMRGFGLILLIDAGSKTHILLAHLSKNLVKNGASVQKGQKIALAGDSESLEGAQVYMELRRSSKAVNPKRYLR